MFNQRTFLSTAAILLLLLASSEAHASWLCPNNGASYATQVECNLLCGGVSCFEEGHAFMCGHEDPQTGEMVTAPCELGAVCPLGDYACQNGSCTQPGVCSSSTVQATRYFCSITTQLYDTSAACTTACQTSYTIGCPAGTSYNATRVRCEATPSCSSGTYNPATNMCESTTTSTYAATLVGGVTYNIQINTAGDYLYSDIATRFKYGYIAPSSFSGAVPVYRGGNGGYLWTNPQKGPLHGYIASSSFSGAVPVYRGGTIGYAWANPQRGPLHGYAASSPGTYGGTYTCNVGDTLSGSTCTHTTLTQTSPICPSGTIFDGTTDKCWAAYIPTCPNGTVYSAAIQKCIAACTTQDVTVTEWACSLNPIKYNTENDCVVGCQSTVACTDKYNCPLGPYECVDLGDPAVFNAAGSSEVTPDMTAYYQNDGEVDPATGECSGTVLLFNGQPKSCRLSGMQTGWKDCCSPDGVITEQVGGQLRMAGQTLSAIPKIYEAYSLANQAVTVFNTVQMLNTAGMVEAIPAAADFVGMGYSAVAVEAGTTAATAGGAATQGLMAGLGITPAGIVIAVVLYVAMEVLMKGCSEEDMMTAAYNELGLCHFVDERCVKNISMMGCVQRAKYYCCFQSKLARIVHEQGRSQLQAFGANGGWVGQFGEYACRGLSPDEFQMLDFSKMDLSEYTNAVAAGVQQNLQQNLIDKTQQKVDGL
jgi:conjugal transfer mating pair stabilization protein TraN